MKKFTNILFSFAIVFIIAGCSSSISLREVGADGRVSYGDSFLFNGGLSAETVNILGNNLLHDKLDSSPEQFIHALEQLSKADDSTRTLIAIMETSQMIADKMRDDPDRAVSYDLTTLIYTNKYFREILKKNTSRLCDPEMIIAIRCYNLALTQLFAYLQERNLHNNGGFELLAAGGQVMSFTMPEFKLPVAREKIITFHLCSDFRPENLTHDNRRFGIGVPLVCELADNAIPETVFAEDQVIPATLVAQISLNGEKQQTDIDHRQIKLSFLDSRSYDEITYKGVTIPMAQDFSTPLAFMIRKPQVFEFLRRTFLADRTGDSEGLYHLEPHNDQRIPVVLVHGLMSDIRTWMQLINTLQSDPELRKHYRFMGFSYSSGNPILASAMHLRQALAGEREKLQKDQRDLSKFDQMVLIGHSMGGLISRMMISTCDDQLLRNFVGKEAYDNSIDRDDQFFRDMLLFSPVPSVKRVIFIAVPHRGAELAQSWIAQMASSLIRLPKSLLDFNAKLIRQLINLPEDQKEILAKKFNGINNLSPDGYALQLLNRMKFAPDIPYHSVIGNKDKAGVPGGSDGVVPYSSSHLNGAASEIVVKSRHSVQQNPLAIQEIKRILKEHLNRIKK